MEKKNCLKIVRNHDKSIQQLLYDAKKNNIRLIGVNEETGECSDNIKKIVHRSNGRKFPNWRKIIYHKDK